MTEASTILRHLISRAPQDESEYQADEGGGERSPGSALAQGHGESQAAGRLVGERPDDEGRNEEQPMPTRADSDER